jgi:hypothetical protein
MTRPYERWSALWNFFIVLDQDWWDEFENEDAAMSAELSGSSLTRLKNARQEWQAAFGTATDAELEDIVLDFNGAYDPSVKFGGYRGWAEWVREHLERELASREP